VFGVGLSKDFKKMLALSLLFHLILILPLFLASLKSRTMIIYSPVYTVDLVSPRKLSRAVRARGKGGVVARSKKKRTGIVSRRRKTEALRKKKMKEEREAMALLSQKLALLRERKKLSERISELEKKREKRKEAEEALAQIERKLKELEKRLEKETAEETEPGEEISRPERLARQPLARRGVTPQTLSIAPEIKAYLNLLDEKVREAWVVPRALVDNREDLMVQVRIIIETNGDVSSIILERPSGNRLFDDSVLRAIQKASPLPVPPEILREGRDYYEVGFRFHYFRGESK